MEDEVLRLTRSASDCVILWAGMPFIMESILGFVIAALLLLMEYGKIVEMNEAD